MIDGPTRPLNSDVMHDVSSPVCRYLPIPGAGGKVCLVFLRAPRLGPQSHTKTHFSLAARGNNHQINYHPPLQPSNPDRPSPTPSCFQSNRMGIPVYWSLSPTVNPPTTLKPTLKRTRPLPSSIRRHPHTRERRPSYSEMVRRRTATNDEDCPQITRPQRPNASDETSEFIEQLEVFSNSQRIHNIPAFIPRAPPLIQALQFPAELPRPGGSTSIRGIPAYPDGIPTPIAESASTSESEITVWPPWPVGTYFPDSNSTSPSNQSPEPIASEQSSEGATYDERSRGQSPGVDELNASELVGYHVDAEENTVRYSPESVRFLSPPGRYGDYQFEETFGQELRF
jgi:hypothetical protein